MLKIFINKKTRLMPRFYSFFLKISMKNILTKIPIIEISKKIIDHQSNGLSFQMVAVKETLAHQKVIPDPMTEKNNK